jgi:hypothetical protein
MRCSSKEPVHVLGLGGVTAHKAVIAQHPDVATLGHGVVKRQWGLVLLERVLPDVDLRQERVDVVLGVANAVEGADLTQFREEAT